MIANLIEGLKEILQDIKDKGLIIIIVLLIVVIGLAVNVRYLQHQYKELTKEQLILQEQQPAYLPQVSESAFVPTIESNVTEINTTKEMISKIVLEKGLDIDVDSFHEMAVKYQIDPGFALAIWAWETGWGTSDAWNMQSNPAGIRCGVEYCTYSYKDEGVEAMLSLLQKYTQGSISYVGERKTPKDIRSTWSETDDVELVVDIWRAIYEGS